jgi:hypothetical protein
MPYIPQARRREFEPETTRLCGKLDSVEHKGDLTYLVYVLAIHSFKGRPSYTSISNAISSLNDAAEEIRRRYLNSYEDKKRKENGDI